MDDGGLFAIKVAVIVTVLVLTIATFGPALWRTLRRPTETPERFTQTPTASALYASDVGSQADSAATTDASVTLFSGGAAAQPVALAVVSTALPLSVHSVDAESVSFHGGGGVSVVASGAWTHASFQLAPFRRQGAHVHPVGKFAQSGPSAGAYLTNIKDVLVKSPCWKLALQNAPVTLESHDLSAATAPLVPEIAKVANLQAFSLAFSAPGTGAGGVSVFVIPRRGGVAPVALRLAFDGSDPTDLVVRYALLSGGVGVAPSVLPQLLASQSPSVTLRHARSGTSPVTVLAQLGRGVARVVVSEKNRDRAYAVAVPALLADSNSLATDQLDPPAVMVAVDRNVVDSMVVPFAVGDLSALAASL